MVSKSQPEGTPIEVSPAHEAQLIALNRQAVTELRKFNAQVIRIYPSLLAEYRTDAQRRISLRPVAQMIGGFKVQYAREFDAREPAITRFLSGLSDQMVAYNKRLWKQNIIEKAVSAGRTVAAQAFAIAAEPGIPQAVSTRWTNTQIGLVKNLGTSRVPSIPYEHFQRLGALVQDAVHSGLRVEELRKQLTELDGVSTRRAEVIARDQAGKYNGKMTEIRHAEIGVKAYFWRDSGDGRVRPLHRQRDRESARGKRFYYAKPPKGGNPGQDYQCRCWADPDLDAVFKDLEKAS
jgi:SPP1 gp7 family putative phage head morphogenesis protein